MIWFLKKSYGDKNLYMCSNCKFEYYDIGYAKYKYCPNCGWFMEPSLSQHSSKVKVKKIPKSCKTCKHSSLCKVAYVEDSENLKYMQKRYCYFVKNEPIEVSDYWGNACGEWKPIKRRRF